MQFSSSKFDKMTNFFEAQAQKNSNQGASANNVTLKPVPKKEVVINKVNPNPKTLLGIKDDSNNFYFNDNMKKRVQNDEDALLSQFASSSAVHDCLGSSSCTSTTTQKNADPKRQEIYNLTNQLYNGNQNDFPSSNISSKTKQFEPKPKPKEALTTKTHTFQNNNNFNNVHSSNTVVNSSTKSFDQQLIEQRRAKFESNAPVNVPKKEERKVVYECKSGEKPKNTITTKTIIETKVSNGGNRHGHQNIVISENVSISNPKSSSHTVVVNNGKTSYYTHY